jgi:hypothetical protein
MRFLKLLLFSFVLVLAGGYVFAQATTPAAPDWKPLIAQLVTAATPFIVFYAIKGLKRILPKVPSWTLPLAAMLIGYVVTYIASVTVAPAAAWYLGPLLGAASVVLNEVIKALNEKGLTGTSTVLFSK